MFEIGRPMPGGGRILDVDRQGGGWGGLENWTIFVDVICVSSITEHLRVTNSVDELTSILAQI